MEKYLTFAGVRAIRIGAPPHLAMSHALSALPVLAGEVTLGLPWPNGYGI